MIVFQQATKPLSAPDWAVAIRIHIRGGKEQYIALALVVSLGVITNPNMEGEDTVLYLAKLMKLRSIRLTRLAHGLSVGGHLEYADDVTLSRSLEGRHDL